MSGSIKYGKYIVALLITGSATLLFSCKQAPVSETYNPETLVTMHSDTLTMITRENGMKKMLMRTPLMERYELAREPYTEFRQGVYVENYKDSAEIMQSTLRADYAINYEKRKLWMATGNVVATGEDGRTLYTEQLFWDEKTGRVYSNVASKVVEKDYVIYGEGFESDDKFENWLFKNYTGRVAIDLEEEREPVEESFPASPADEKAKKSQPEEENPSSSKEPEREVFIDQGLMVPLMKIDDIKDDM